MKSLFIFLSGILLLLGGCSQYTLLDGKVLNDADLAGYHTFHIVSPDEGKLPPQMSMVSYHNLADAIKKQMEMRGYREASDSPLLINIGITVRDNIETKSAFPPSYSPYYMSPRGAYFRSYYGSARIITDISKEGVLTIDLVDRKDNKYLYTASVGNIINPNNDKMKDRAEIDRAVEALFRNFPVHPHETR